MKTKEAIKFGKIDKFLEVWNLYARRGDLEVIVRKDLTGGV